MAREMKDSGIEWIGQIPERWDLIRLENCMTQINEKNTKLKMHNILSLSKKNGVTPYEDRGNQGNKSKEDLSEYKLAYKNTIIANSMNILIGSVGISYYDGCVSPVYYVFKNNTNVNLKFLNYIMQTTEFQKQLRRYANGILEIRLRVSYEDLVKQKIPFPPLSEQQKIADFLDEKVKEIDNAIEKTKETIELYKKYKQAIITEAVTKGLDPNVKMKDSGIEWVSRIPHNWKTMRIANLYFERSENGNDNLPILLVSINVGISDHELDETEMVKKTIRSEDKTKYKVVHPNDLVYNMMRAWQGAFGCARVDGMVSPAYVIVQPKCRIDSRYFEALLRTNEGKEEVNSFSYGVADFRKRLYWNKFRNIKVPVPPLEEQKEISNFIDNVTSKIDELIESKQALINKLVQYKKSVIYEYVTGKKEVK